MLSTISCGAYILLMDLAAVVTIACYWLYRELGAKRDN